MMIRIAVRVASIALLLAICLPIWAVLRLFGDGTGMVCFFLGRVGWLLGLRVRIVGTPVRRNVLYVANHITWLDILALGGARHTQFIAKSEIAGWPVVGWLAKIGGSVFVARERRSSTRSQANAVVDALKSGHPVGLFAEGGTGDGVTLDPFRPALFAAAVEAGVMVQPVAIDYGDRSAEIAWPDGTGFATEGRRMIGRPAPVRVTLHFLEPLDARMLDRKVLATESHRAIAAVLGQS
ncbi:lysophospholipid acyltransferase family protein [Sphingomonas sp. MMS24-J13]|uniref:lysophospholipid acyltransferase family protein n=1 Tax=Sphingomonas sp. MMS24-J13 TaxID=3238686 RepID=UPI00384C838D